VNREGGQRGAETLEFTAVAGLVALVLTIGLRALAIAELQLRIETDARALARDAAVCERNGAALDLVGVDAGLPSGSGWSTRRTPDGLVSVTVTVPGQEILPQVAATSVTPRATVAMRREPGCP
jgi:hypothetical protein